MSQIQYALVLWLTDNNYVSVHHLKNVKRPQKPWSDFRVGEICYAVYPGRKGPDGDGCWKCEILGLNASKKILEEELNVYVKKKQASLKVQDASQKSSEEKSSKRPSGSKFQEDDDSDVEDEARAKKLRITTKMMSETNILKMRGTSSTKEQVADGRVNQNLERQHQTTAATSNPVTTLTDLNSTPTNDVEKIWHSKLTQLSEGGQYNIQRPTPQYVTPLSETLSGARTSLFGGYETPYTSSYRSPTMYDMLARTPDSSYTASMIEPSVCGCDCSEKVEKLENKVEQLAQDVRGLKKALKTLRENGASSQQAQQPEQEVLPTGFSKSEIEKRLDQSPSVTAALKTTMPMVFTLPELLNSSLKGQKSGKTKQGNARCAFDVQRREYLTAAVMARFNVEEKFVNDKMRNRLKIIRENHFEEVHRSVPVARTEVWEEEPTSARLRWHRAYIPRYYSSTPISYRVEMQEAGDLDTEWKSVASDIRTSDYTVKNISPRKDYRFRIRAQTENGDVSEPTPPIQFYRTRVPLLKDSENALAEFKPVEYKAIFLKHPYYEQLTKYVPPTMPIHKPDMIIIDQETVELSWRPAIVAEAIRGQCNLTYTIEVRCPPSFEWRQLVTGLKVCSHTVQKLHPRIDYIFRVRAWNEYGCSDAGLPVSLYRPAVYKIEGEDLDDEEFEKEWERKYGTKVPPKLPIDTPRIVTQTSDSIWFTWLPARIPAYATQTNISYVVEIKEPPSTAWQRDAADLVDCQYVKEGLNPNQEYHIRVRAETEFGPSDATMPIIIRGKGSRSGSRRSSVEREERSMDDKIDLSYLDNVMAGVPPRMASSRPLSSSVGPDKLTLTWSPCRTPSYVKASSVTYIIEKREPPGHVWTVLAKDITGHKFEITGLNPEQDYMFRVRARNEFGLSDPTLPMTLFRDRDDYVPPRIRSRSSSRDSISLLVSKHMRRSASIDYNIQPMEDDRSSQERIPCQPQYITTTFDTQYGVLGKKGKIQLEVRGYPLPTVHWYKGEEKIDYGGQYNAFVTPSGGITLEIKNVGLDTVGQFKCYAENGSGAAVKMVTFELAEPPTVLETIKDISLLKGESATLSCRVDGFPSPTVKWMKDWRPLADCTRTKMVNVPPETYNLEIMQLIEEDDGLYACTVENMAGKVTVTGRLRVEIDSFPEREINIRSSPIEEHYHVLEEIGRGRYGVVRRVIEISTGRTFAANFMSMRNKAQKHFFMNEFEVLRSISKMDGVLKLYDAFETERSLIFVTEILSEPELLEKIITDGSWTEARVAAIIKKLLAILQELAQLNILHLDIKPSNIRMCGADLDDIKLLGFGLSRVLQSEEDITHNYGSVGYASPEQVTNEALKPNTDLWSVGVLSYLLLSGNGPFTGSSEVEILKYMAENSWTFEGRGFNKFSKEGLDFISKLLVKDPSKRMTIEECMSHPWLSTTSDIKINTEQLKQFYNAEKLQRQTEKVFTTVQLQSFAKIIHGAKALYQPAVDIESGEIIFPDSELYGDYLDEDAWYEWQLQYQDDPDSQIFPIQDKKFTVRECRHAGAPKYTTPKQMERADKDILDTGTGILFRDKIQATTFLVGEDVTFTAKVVSETGEIPVVTWYRDEQLLSDDYRADASYNPETGLAKLKIIKSKDYDAAVYKCVARIKEGRVSCEARLLLGDVPSKPGRPLVTQTSGTEAFLTWTGPVSDGNAYLLGYRVDYRKEGEKKWTQGPYVTEEYALLSGLEPNTTYIFRVSVHNRYGASPFSWSSLETRTLAKDAPKVAVAMDLQPLMQFSTFDKQQLILPAESRRPSLTVAEEPKINESDPNEIFTFADTISKGSYGEYKLCTNKSTNQQCVAKIVPYNKDKHADITAEFELLRTLSQANVVSVLDSYISADQFYVIYEHLSGINIVQYFCLHKAYKEETVACLVRQVLDALQYLEHFGIVHLNLQPTSMVMATRRRPHVKLRDFTLAHKVEDDKGVKVPLAGFPDFTPPEILKGENVNFTADLWTLGAVTFTLMSGISPFGGKNLEETLSRILFDRYSTKEMYDNVTPESVKFVVKLLSRLPRNRPTVTKCLNSSWLNLGESMVNARNSRMFKSEKLRAFSVDYLAKRSDIDYNLAVVDIEKLPKPDEEEIEKETTNRYIDDALMFC